MDNQETDRRLREVFRRNDPSFGRDEADVVTQAARSQHLGPGRSHNVLRRVGIAVAVLAVGIGVAAGVWQAVAHLGGNNPIILITDQTTSTGLPTATSTSVSVGGTTAAQSLKPFVAEAQVQEAAKVVDLYFNDLRTGKAAEFKKLIGTGIGMDGGTLWKWERDYVQKSGQDSCTVGSQEAFVWAGEWYAPPTTKVRADVDSWIRADPSNRVGFKVIAVDGTLRYFRAERQTVSGNWLLIPTEAVLEEPGADASVIEVATPETQALARQVLAALQEQFPPLAGAVINSHGIMDAPRMREFAVHFTDDMKTPHWTLFLVLQKDVASISGGALEKTSPLSLAGARAGWIKDNLPFNAQVVILLKDGTMVNVGEGALHTAEGEGQVPLDLSELKRAVELIAQQFGAVGF
jgi:hypothetical protein